MNLRLTFATGEIEALLRRTEISAKKAQKDLADFPRGRFKTVVICTKAQASPLEFRTVYERKNLFGHLVLIHIVLFPGNLYTAKVSTAIDSSDFSSVEAGVHSAMRTLGLTGTAGDI